MRLLTVISAVTARLSYRPAARSDRPMRFDIERVERMLAPLRTTPLFRSTERQVSAALAQTEEPMTGMSEIAAPECCGSD